MTTRSPVGIPGVDQILHGGLLQGRSYLLAGSAGTGKTIFGLQWLRNGHAEGERCLYITLAEPTGDVSDNISAFGWSLDGLTVVDLTPSDLDNQSVWDEEYHIFSPEDVENLPYWRKIYEAIQTHKPQRLVLDSLTQLRYVSVDDFQFRKKVILLVAILSRLRCIAIFLYEPQELVEDASVALAVDGIFRLRKEISHARVVGLRDFQVEKMRGSDFLLGMHPLTIGPHGIHIFPHVIEKTGLTHPGETMIPSGVANLDQMLGGGVESGTTSLMTGPSGVGKSTLCTVFLRHNVITRKERAVYYSFEESRNSLVARCAGLGIDIEQLLVDGDLKFKRVNPMELYPDQFLDLVRHDVEVEGRMYVALDSLRGYYLAMEEFGKPKAHLHNLTTYLNRKGVTTFMTNESSNTLSGTLQGTELAMSHLADNIFVLRYADYHGKVIKVVGCLKKRIGFFSAELRELILRPGPDGVIVGDTMLKGLQGILAGAPVAATPDESEGVGDPWQVT